MPKAARKASSARVTRKRRGLVSARTSTRPRAAPVSRTSVRRSEDSPEARMTFDTTPLTANSVAAVSTIAYPSQGRLRAAASSCGSGGSSVTAPNLSEPSSIRSVDYSDNHVSAVQNPDRLRTFWGGQLNRDPNSIRLQRKSNSNQLAKRTWRCRHGVMTVRTSGTYLRARLEAWMDCLKAQWIDSLAVGV